MNNGDSESRATLTAERWKTTLAAVAFFLLLCSYYVLRPVRDNIAVASGADKVQWLFTGTFLATLAAVPLFGWFVQRFPKGGLVPLVYGLMIACLGGFYSTFLTGVTTLSATAFFIWLSLFNLTIISLFWSCVSDTFTTQQAARRYGYITAAGTAGAVTGPLITAYFAKSVGISQLLLISMGLLTIALVAIIALQQQSSGANHVQERAIGGSILAGITHTFSSPLLAGIAGLVICYSAVSTVLYVEMTDLVGKAFSDPGERTAYFARIDLTVNLLALGVQIFATQSIILHWGIRWALCLVPGIVLLGLGIAGATTTITFYAAILVIHRAGEFSLSKPAREILYTTVDVENRYKAKNFIDTAVYRANDAISAWTVGLIRSNGLSAIWWIAIPVTILWLFICRNIGTRSEVERSLTPAGEHNENEGRLAARHRGI